MTCVTKLTLAAKAAILFFVEVFKILFGQLVERMVKNKSIRECEAPLPTPARRVHLWCIFLALPVKNGPDLLSKTLGRTLFEDFKFLF